MDEFTPITTQEQLNAVIGERLKREREATVKKYGDYDALKQQSADYEKQLTDLQKGLEAAGQKGAAQEQTIAQLTQKLQGYEAGALKMRVAHEVGIPYELAGRLCGQTEADVRKDAESLAKLLGATRPAAPLCSTEHSVADPTQAALKTLTDNLLRGE